MTDNFDERLDDFKSKIDGFFDTDATHKLKVDLRDFTIQDIENVVSEQFRLIEARLKTFTDVIKAVSENSDNQKLIVDMTRISSDLNTVYAKITTQDSALQNIVELLKSIDGKEDGDNILKIMNELGNFYRGFDSITLSINKNFTEFLNEYRQTSAKEEFKKLSIDIEGINNNTNSIISALSIIDHKYQDLQNLILKLSDNESKFIESLDWLNKINNQVLECNQKIALLPQNETTEVLAKNLEILNAKLETGFSAVANLDKATKDQLSMKFADILSRLTDITSAVEHTHFDEKFALLNNYIANSLSDFSELIVKNLDTTEKFENVENKINISFDEFSKRVDEKFLEFQKLDELKSTISSNLVELANYLTAKFDEVKKYNEVEDKVASEIKGAVDVLSEKFDSVRKYEEIESKVSNSFSMLARAVDSRLEEIRKYDEIEEKISALFANFAENTNVKLAEVDKFESFGEFVCKNLSLLKEELLANINDTTSLNELGGKISNMLNAISSELVEKIDKIGSLDEARSQILLLLTQFTSEMEQKIASIDQADTVKNEISSSISSLLAQVEEKISKIDCAISNNSSVLANKIDEKAENIIQNVASNSAKLLYDIDLIKDKISSLDEKASGNLEGVSGTLEEIKSCVNLISNLDIREQLEQNYNNLSSNICGLQSLINQTDDLENALNSLILDFSNKNEQNISSVKQEILSLVSQLENTIKQFASSFGENLDSKIQDIKSEFVKLGFEVQEAKSEFGKIDTQIQEAKSEFLTMLSGINEQSKNIEQSFSQKLDAINSYVSNLADEKIALLLDDIRNSKNPIYEDFARVSDSVIDKINIVYSVLSDFEAKYSNKNDAIIDGIKDLKDTAVYIPNIDGQVQKINRSLDELNVQTQDIKNFAYDLVEIKNQNNDIKNLMGLLSDDKKTSATSGIASKINEILFTTKENFEELLKKSSQNYESLSEKFDENYNMFAKKADDNFNKLVGNSEQDIDMIFQKLDEMKAEILNASASSSGANTDGVIQIVEKNSDILTSTSNSIINSINDIVDDIKAIAQNAISTKGLIGDNQEKVENAIQKIQNDVQDIFSKSNDFDSKLYQFAILIEQLKTDLTQSLKSTVQEGIREEVASSNTEIYSEIQSINSSYNSLVSVQEDISERINELKSCMNNSADSGFDKVLSNLEKATNSLDNLRVENTAIIEKTDNVESKLADKIDVLEAKLSALGEIVKSSQGIKEDDLKSFMSGFEFLHSNLISEIKSELKDGSNSFDRIKSEFLDTINPQMLKELVMDSIEKKFIEFRAENAPSTYTFDDIESDFAKIKLLLDKEQKSQLPARLEEIRNIGLENIKLNRKSDKQMVEINDWIDGATKILQSISDKVDKAEKLNLQEIKARLVQSETASDSSEIIDIIDDFRSDLNKKHQIQEIKIENMDEKLATMLQKQAEPINFSSIVKLIEANARQTNSLISRIDGIENQILSIQTNIEKLINYIEE